MTSPQDDARSITFIQKITKTENELLRKWEELKDKPDKITEVYKILRERIDLLRGAKNVPVHPYYKLFIMATERDAIHDASLVWVKNQFQEQVSQIITRLDNLENEIKKLKEEKLNDNDDDDVSSN